MVASIQEVDSNIGPAELASLLASGLVVRFRDSGCLAGYSASRENIMGVGPNAHLDYVGGFETLADEVPQILFWAREWAEFRLSQTSRR
ncbi:hypothetical protein F6X40_09365 [Paraburkholderia sp. UCT31]|uniref:hypothetical protein n=1 Tax=Paraburkholderia sp. UCT31 TaxID=2615209 RepID=UPI0016562118|nr:hypothetical protein [Paraburkholderia sp. UCT31]MBC8737016.1 hypothetical protein [Paraburkholderia sp. UCT31]